MRLLSTVAISLATCVGGNYLWSRYVREEPEITERLRERVTTYALDKVKVSDVENYARHQFEKNDYHLAEEVVKLNQGVGEAYCRQKKHTKYRRALRCDEQHVPR